MPGSPRPAAWPVSTCGPSSAGAARTASPGGPAARGRPATASARAQRSQASADCGIRQRAALRQHTAGPHRPDAGRRGRLCRQRGRFLPRATRPRPDAAPRPPPLWSAGPPSTHVATAPGEVWCWDVIFLPIRAQGRWFSLFLILDLLSRKIVGFEVHETDQTQHAAHLVRRTALGQSGR